MHTKATENIEDSLNGMSMHLYEFIKQIANLSIAL